MSKLVLTKALGEHLHQFAPWKNVFLASLPVSVFSRHRSSVPQPQPAADTQPTTKIPEKFARGLLATLLAVYVSVPTTLLVMFRGPEIVNFMEYMLDHSLVSLGMTGLVVLATFLLQSKFQIQKPSSVALIFLIMSLAVMSLWVDHLLLYQWENQEQAASISLPGKVAVVTGANSGIGLATAKVLAQHGISHLVLTCRTVTRCDSAVRQVVASSSNNSTTVSVVALELRSLTSVQQAVQELRAQHSQIHYVFANAGSTPSYPLTEEGLEDGFGAMYLGHAALSLGLLPSLRQAGTATEPARIILVASEMAIAAATGFFGLNVFDDSILTGDGEGDLRGELTRGDGTTQGSLGAYGRAKLATVLFAMELNRRLKKQDWPVIAHAVHSGAVDTTAANWGVRGMFRPVPMLPWLVSKVYMPLLWRSPRQGAQTLLHAALATNPPEMLEGGQYLSGACLTFSTPNDIKDTSNLLAKMPFQNMKIYKDPHTALKMADEKWSTRLWEVSIRLLAMSAFPELVVEAP